MARAFVVAALAALAGKWIETRFRTRAPPRNGSGGGGGAPEAAAALSPCVLVGGVVRTFLLEKVRLVHHAAGERNYHVFYEVQRCSPNLLTHLEE